MTILVKSTIKAETVVINDEFQLAGNTRVIADIKVGRKWVTARDAAGKLIFEAEIGTEIEVGRWELTQEEIDERNAEREAEHRAYRAEAMLKSLRQMADAKVELTGRDVLDYSKLASALQNQAKAELAATILDAIAFKQSRGETDVVTIVEGYVEHTMRSVIFRSSNALSRSSSVTSNLIEDVQRSVFCELADNVTRGYYL